MVRYYYMTYFIISAFQGLIALRTLFVLHDAGRMRSAFALATVFVAGMNAVDLLMIHRALCEQSPTPESMLLQIFWFGIRNIFSIGYWIKYVLVFRK